VIGGGSVDKPLRIGGPENLIQENLSLRLGRDSLEDFLKRIQQMAETELRSTGSGRGESDYLCHLSGVLVRRALEAAIGRWKSR
jgi:hypothetical protein